MKPSAPRPDLETIRSPIIRSAVEAIQSRDKEGWFELFIEKPKFSDDGIPRDFAKWCGEELFGSARAYIISVYKVEDGGLTFYARYHSDKWGDFKTFWKFVVENGKISRLDVGATDY